MREMNWDGQFCLNQTEILIFALVIVQKDDPEMFVFTFGSYEACVVTELSYIQSCSIPFKL